MTNSKGQLIYCYLGIGGWVSTCIYQKQIDNGTIDHPACDQCEHANPVLLAKKFS